MPDKPHNPFTDSAGGARGQDGDPLADFVDIIGDEQVIEPLEDFEDVLATDEAEDVFSKVVTMPGVPSEPVDDPLDTAQVGTIETMLEELIAQMHEAKTVPLSQNVLVDKAAFITNLERIRSLLPEELRAARWMIREQTAYVSRTNEKSKEILDRASQSAHAVLSDARTAADEMVSQSSIVSEAVEEANILVRNAEAEGRTVRLQAEDYSEDRLLQLEHLFGNLLRQVRDTRSEFHQARPAGAEAPILE